MQDVRNWCVGVGLDVEVFDRQALMRMGRFFYKSDYTGMSGEHCIS